MNLHNHQTLIQRMANTKHINNFEKNDLTLISLFLFIEFLK